MSPRNRNPAERPQSPDGREGQYYSDSSREGSKERFANVQPQQNDATVTNYNGPGTPPMPPPVSNSESENQRYERIDHVGSKTTERRQASKDKNLLKNPQTSSRLQSELSTRCNTTNATNTRAPSVEEGNIKPVPSTTTISGSQTVPHPGMSSTRTLLPPHQRLEQLESKFGINYNPKPSVVPSIPNAPAPGPDCTSPTAGENKTPTATAVAYDQLLFKQKPNAFGRPSWAKETGMVVPQNPDGSVITNPANVTVGSFATSMASPRAGDSSQLQQFYDNMHKGSVQHDPSQNFGHHFGHKIKGGAMGKTDTGRQTPAADGQSFNVGVNRSGVGRSSLLQLKNNIYQSVVAKTSPRGENEGANNVNRQYSTSRGTGNANFSLQNNAVRRHLTTGGAMPSTHPSTPGLPSGGTPGNTNSFLSVPGLANHVNQIAAQPLGLNQKSYRGNPKVEGSHNLPAGYSIHQSFNSHRSDLTGISKSSPRGPPPQHTPRSVPVHPAQSGAETGQENVPPAQNMIAPKSGRASPRPGFKSGRVSPRGGIREGVHRSSMGAAQSTVNTNPKASYLKAGQATEGRAPFRPASRVSQSSTGGVSRGGAGSKSAWR